MADIDTLPRKGIPFNAVVDELGIAVGGTLNAKQLAQRGMTAVCAVDSAGVAASGSTLKQLQQRGIRGVCVVDQTGVTSDTVTLRQLSQRGIFGICPVDTSGIAVNGTATLAQLSQRGIAYLCPVDEAGTYSSIGGAVSSEALPHFPVIF